MINGLQKVIIRAFIETYGTSAETVRAIRDAFPINTLCEMLGINRNRYYYLLRVHELDRTIRERIIEPVVRSTVDDRT